MNLSESEISHYRIERTFRFFQRSNRSVPWKQVLVPIVLLIQNPIPGISFYRVVSIDEGGMK
jgi:hypothetical protein